MNKTHKLLALSAVAALMIAATAMVPMSDADTTANTRNNIAINSTVGQQNSNDTTGGGGGDTNGGNYVGGDLCVSGTSCC